MNREETLKAVIDKYELSEPVPPYARAAMEKSRKENLIRILNRETRRTFFITAVVSFFLWIKKFGISLSLAKSAAAVSAALIISAGVITAGGVYTAVKVKEFLSANKQSMEKKHESSSASDKIAKPAESAEQELLKYTVAVSRVEMDSVSRSMNSEYQDTMIKELRRIKGEKAAISINSLDNYHTSDRTLIITIIKLDEKTQKSETESVYRISAKIVSTANSRVFMHTSVTAEGEKMIPDSIQKLAEKIADKI